ncbi:MAG TPA: DUF971 domain-containing protein [Thermoflexales bacterium]|jgi:DUF971 family protein|nr:DUF971 domain-containing protein [Thermoflexales bacterium]
MKPVSITADKKRAHIAIRWDDGATVHYPFTFLSAACPCATCNEERNDTNPLKILKPKSDILAAITPVGSYAVNLVWQGGCRNGIYTWEMFEDLRKKHPEWTTWASIAPPKT